MRAQEFLGTEKKRAGRKGLRHQRGHTPVPGYKNTQSEEHLDELSFLGSPCTKDCSGHRAGYEWYKRKQRAPNSWSQSFNNGAALAAQGK